MQLKNIRQNASFTSQTQPIAMRHLRVLPSWWGLLWNLYSCMFARSARKQTSFLCDCAAWQNAASQVPQLRHAKCLYLQKYGYFTNSFPLSPRCWHLCTSPVHVPNVWNVPEMKTFLPLSFLDWSLCQGRRKCGVVWTSGSIPDLAHSLVTLFCLLVSVHGLPIKLISAFIRWEACFGGPTCILHCEMTLWGQNLRFKDTPEWRRLVP